MVVGSSAYEKSRTFAVAAYNAMIRVAFSPTVTELH